MNQEQSMDIALTGLGIMAQEDKQSLVEILSESGSLADYSMSTEKLIDLSLKAIKDSPKFRQLLSGYFTKSIEESMKEEIGLSFSGGEDFFSADGDDDEEIIEIYGDAMRNADGDDDGIFNSYPKDDDDYQEQVIDDDLSQPSFSGGEDFFNANGDDEEYIEIYN